MVSPEWLHHDKATVLVEVVESIFFDQMKNSAAWWI